VVVAQVRSSEKSVSQLFRHPRIGNSKPLFASGKRHDEGQLASIEKSVILDGEFLEPKLYSKLLVQRLILQFKLQQYGDALATSDSLIEKDIEIPAGLTKKVRIIEGWRSEGDVFYAKGKIGPAPEDHDGLGRWRYRVAGNQPGIIDVTGQLDRMKMRCDYKSVVSRDPTGKAWRIPKDWGSCWMYVYGKPGTTFSLVEYPAG